MPCYAFMGGLFQRYKNQESADELIHVAADEGEQIDIIERIPEEPGSKLNMRIKDTPKTITIEPFPRPGEEGSRLGPTLNIRNKMEERMRARARAERNAYRAGLRPDDEITAPKVSDADEPKEEKSAKAGRR